MLKNKKIIYFSIFVLVIFTLSLISSWFNQRSLDTAAVIQSIESKKDSLISTANNNLAKAEELNKNLHNSWTPNFLKNTYKNRINELMVQRKNLIISAIKNNIVLNDVVLPSSVLKSSVDSNLVEKSINLKNANLISYDVDDVASSREEIRYSIYFDSKKYNLIPSISMGDTSGAITVFGLLFGSDLYANTSNISVTKNNRQNLPPESNSEHNVLVILVNYQDTQDPVPFTKEQAKELIFGSSSSFWNLMKEQSYGKVKLTGDVYGWLTVNHNAGDYSGNFLGCSEADIQQELDTFALQNNIDISKYQHLFFIHNCLTYSGHDISTPGAVNYSLGGKDGVVSILHLTQNSEMYLQNSLQINPHVNMPFSWTNLNYALSHEFGHSLGLSHDSGVDCNNTQISPPCTNIEYGSTLDVMGSHNIALHFNAYYKKALGWLTDNDVLALDKTGTYKLSPVETPVINDPKSFGYSGLKKLAVLNSPVTGWPMYTIEYRAGNGYDSPMKQIDGAGIYIYKIEGSKTHLVDSQPTNANWYDDAAFSKITPESPFIDSTLGFKVVPSTVDNFGASFDAYVECLESDPTFMSNNGNYNFGGFQNGYYYVSSVANFMNNDSLLCHEANIILKVEPVSAGVSLGDVFEESNYFVLPQYAGSAYKSVKVNGVVTGHTYEYKSTLGRKRGLDKFGNQVIDWTNLSWNFHVDY